MQHDRNSYALNGAQQAFGRARIFTLSLLAVAVLAACGGSDDHTPEPPVAKPLELTVLHINDHHSNLDSKSKTLQLRNALGERVPVSVDAGGFPRITSAFAALAAQSGNVLKLHAGDALTGTLYFSRAGELGEADAAMMNTVCFDAFTLGNHEFDKGDTELKQWLELLNSGACQTPILSANVQFGANSALNPSRAPGVVQPYTIIERDGQPIGVVGLTIAAKTKASSAPDPDTTFEDEVVAAQRAIDELHGQGVNKIVLLSHIGYDYDKRVLAQLSGVDVVIGGDSHTLLGPDSLTTYGVGSSAGAYGQALKNRDGDTVCVAQAWEYSQVVGELKVGFDGEGRVTSCSGTPHVLISDDFQIGGSPASGADRAAISADIAASGFLRVTAPDAQATAVLEPYRESVEVYKETEVANAPLELCSRRVPGGPGSADYSRSSAACNAEGSVDVRGGDIQQVVAQSYLEVANLQYGGADFTLQSGGGVRIPLEGRITAANVIEVLPFDNKLWKLSITGAEAKAMIEDGLEAVFGPSGSTGPYPYAGGLRWDVDANQSKGSRASNFERFDSASNSWLPLDEAATYSLFVLGFNATGGDGYTTLANVPDERRFEVGVQDADVFQTYIDSLPKDATGLPALLRLDHSLYSTKSFIGPAAR
ncbi:MAG: 5'-nucleotidase C-terminal domain-containing protein [Pigmentiphaga sp.]|nr:5'-nucleotidase C-terminal domain-containing protein [Pigmentiphaga sp.]